VNQILVVVGTRYWKLLKLSVVVATARVEVRLSLLAMTEMPQNHDGLDAKSCYERMQCDVRCKESFGKAGQRLLS